jgi:hypothetical protein
MSQHQDSHSQHGVDPLDPDGVYWDPMEEPGASLCADCGMYPIAPGEAHDCPDGPPPGEEAHAVALTAAG